MAEEADTSIDIHQNLQRWCNSV